MDSKVLIRELSDFNVYETVSNTECVLFVDNVAGSRELDLYANEQIVGFLKL
jgi:hypothetical protein